MSKQNASPQMLQNHNMKHQELDHAASPTLASANSESTLVQLSLLVPTGLMCWKASWGSEG